MRAPVLLGTGLLILASLALIMHPPLANIGRDEIGVRSNRLTGGQTIVAGSALMLPGIHALRRFPIADAESVLRSDEHGSQPLTSSEGMAVSTVIRVRYAIDPRQLTAAARDLPDDISGTLLGPLLREIAEGQFAARGVLAIVSEQRQSLHAAISAELAAALSGHGLLLRSLSMPEIRLPAALADRIHRPSRMLRADGESPLQTSDGLSIGAEIDIRYALDPQQLVMLARRPANDIESQLLASLVQGVVYKRFAQFTVRDIHAGQREQLKDAIAEDLQPLMAKDGLLLRSVTLGNIDLPADFRAGMDRLLAAELATQQMEHTLALTAKQVIETGLRAEADKVRREKAAEAAANEQVIAAKAQEEAMKHVLPFKQKQVEQRRLEADADTATRISQAEASAGARRIEAAAEADSRRILTDADAYRVEQLGKLASTQLERDGALISRYPLLIQKTMADKLSDKISVIIAPPPGDGGFIGNTLLGATSAGARGEQP